MIILCFETWSHFNDVASLKNKLAVCTTHRRIPRVPRMPELLPSLQEERRKDKKRKIICWQVCYLSDRCRHTRERRLYLFIRARLTLHFSRDVSINIFVILPLELPSMLVFAFATMYIYIYLIRFDGFACNSGAPSVVVVTHDSALRSSVQRLWASAFSFRALPWPTKPLTWPETIVNEANQQLGQSRLYSISSLSFPGYSAKTSETITIMQTQQGTNFSWLVHLRAI